MRSVPAAALAPLLAMLVLAVPGAAAAEAPGLGAQLTLDGTISHGGGVGTTLHLDAHFASTAVRASLMGSMMTSFVSLDGEAGAARNIAGGKLLAPALGVRQVLHQGPTGLQPWVAGGLGYGWFWFDEEDLGLGRLGIDSRRAAWYLEAGFDLLATGGDSGFGKSLSLRALSGPVGMLWFVSFGAFWDDRD